MVLHLGRCIVRSFFAKVFFPRGSCRIIIFIVIVVEELATRNQSNSKRRGKVFMLYGACEKRYTGDHEQWVGESCFLFHTISIGVDPLGFANGPVPIRTESMERYGEEGRNDILSRTDEVFQ